MFMLLFTVLSFLLHPWQSMREERLTRRDIALRSRYATEQRGPAATR